MKYEFSNVVFTPGKEVALTVDGQAKALSKQSVVLLQYFLETNEQVSDNNKILAEVWGEGEHTYDAVRKAVSRLNRLLPADAQIKNVRMEGYVLNVDLTKVETHYNKTELILAKSPFAKNVTIVSLASLFLLSVAALGVWTGVGKWIDPPPVYAVQNVEAVFTRDHVVGFPQLSPDGNFVAHFLSNKLYEDDHLALTNLTSGKTTLLAKMRLDGGFKWDLSGDKIVYQQRTKTSCQVRLLQFDANQQVTDDHLLNECLIKSGSLTFAWFNEHEFYVNFVDNERAGLPLHQIYSFDSRTKLANKLLTAKDEGGLGFFSLEYDKSTDSLYMLRTRNFVKTDFYRYRDGQLTKLARLDFEVRQYGVANDQLIYENEKNEFVINEKASDFDAPQVLLPSPMMPIAEPHFNGNKLAFMAGNTIGLALNKLTDNQLRKVEFAGFSPSVMANYNESLIFVSDQTGVHQIYQRRANNDVVQISDMRLNERIKYINVAGDIFAVSYYDKVHFYQYQDGKLIFKDEILGYTNGFLSASGATVLLSTALARKPTGELVEMRLSDLQLQPLNINNTVLAAYYEGDVIYVDKQHRLHRFTANNHELIAENTNVRSFEQALVQREKLYYIATKAGQNYLFSYSLRTGEKTAVALDGGVPTRMIVINDEVYIRVREVLRPKLMIGNVTKK